MNQRVPLWFWTMFIIAMAIGPDPVGRTAIIGKAVYGVVYGAASWTAGQIGAAAEYGLDKYHVAMIRRELDPAWWESKKQWATELEQAIKRNGQELKACSDYIGKAKNDRDRYERERALSHVIFKLDEKRRVWTSWHDEAIRSYNAAVMRHSCGLQYRGVETTLLRYMDGKI